RRRFATMKCAPHSSARAACSTSWRLFVPCRNRAWLHVMSCVSSCVLWSALLFQAFTLLARAEAPAGDGQRALLARADDAYFRGAYAEAAEAYERLIELGNSSPALLYNLGTSLGRAGKTGPAVYALRRAAARAPGDRDVRNNLGAVREQARSKQTA